MADYVVFDFEVQFGLGCGVGLGKVNFVAIFRLVGFLQWQIAFGGDDFHFLICIRMGGRNPDRTFFPAGKFFTVKA